MLDVSVQAIAANCACSESDFVQQEILRLGAPADEMASARAFLASDKSYSPRAYQSLPPRVRRLVDLLTVAGDDAMQMPSPDSA